VNVIFSYAAELAQAEAELQVAVDTLNRMESGRHICMCGGLTDYLSTMEDARRNLDELVSKVDRLKYLEQQEQLEAEEERARIRGIQVFHEMQREEQEKRERQQRE